MPREEIQGTPGRGRLPDERGSMRGSSFKEKNLMGGLRAGCPTILKGELSARAGRKMVDQTKESGSTRMLKKWGETDNNVRQKRGADTLGETEKEKTIWGGKNKMVAQPAGERSAKICHGKKKGIFNGESEVDEFPEKKGWAKNEGQKKGKERIGGGRGKKTPKGSIRVVFSQAAGEERKG